MNTTAAIVALQNQAGQKDTIIGKLHEQIRDLTERLDQSCGERDQTIGQFEQNERIWKEKLERKQEECTQVLKLHSQLKEDNTDALFQIDKLVNTLLSIDDHFLAGTPDTPHSVLVHCLRGANRAPVVVAAYILGKVFKATVSDVVQYLTRLRHIVDMTKTHL